MFKNAAFLDLLEKVHSSVSSNKSGKIKNNDTNKKVNVNDL